MDESMEKPSNGNKKLPLEELDREELVKRCKSYLALAQRAKAAKDEAQQRESSHLDKISTLEDQVLLVSRSEEMQAKLQLLEENYGQQKDGFVEELNKMNDVLKQRGETITRLEERCQTYEKDFKTKTETLLQVIAERERKIEALESEVNRFETQSEMMSTSTVSKAEEIHRMKDVEDSLEERYNKLKMLAVKMKKKIAEQTTQLQDKDNQLATLKKDDKKSFPNSSLNMLAVQKEIDRLTDELDSRKAEMAVMKKDCENAIQELANSKQRAEEFKNEVSILKTTATNLEKSKKVLENALQEQKTLFDDCRKENESDKILRVELSKECDRLKDEIRQLHDTVSELRNQAVKQDCKKQNLLQLELTDYEKSMSELNSQLDSVKKEVAIKQSLLDQSTEEKFSLRSQIQHLELQTNSEQQKATELEMTLESVQTQLDSCQAEVRQQRDDIRQLTTKSQCKESEIDQLKLQLSTADAQLHRIQTTSNLQVDTLRKQVATLEEAAAAIQTGKDDLEAQLCELRADYENYKIRATSVLKKQNATTSAKEPTDDFNTDQVEREMLQRVVEALKTKLGELESQLALSQSEVSSLRTERERTAATQASNVDALHRRLERSETEMEAVKREHQAQMSRLHGDNQLLASLHREQMDGIKLRHTREILELQNKLDQVGLESERLQKMLSAGRTTSPLVQRRDEVAMLERERGEGSEDGNNESRHEDDHNDSRKPIPLELLLNSPSLSEESIILQPEPAAVSPDQYKQLLAIAEKRYSHMAALLAESEANEARLSQLTSALKEEIRRSERCEERQKHIENLEYLKNIVLKFVTLPRGEERSRLVPVLTTLLRLSPAEVQEVHQTFSRTTDAVARPMAWGGVFNYFAPNQ